MKKLNGMAWLAGLGMSALTFAVHAATMIEMTSNGHHGIVITDGHKARMSSNREEYMLLDFDAATVKMVAPAKKRILTMKLANAKGGVTPVKLTLKPTGRHADVAGFGAEQYDWLVNGKRCGSLLASKPAMKVEGVAVMMDAMRKLMRKQREAMGGFAMMMDDCKQGEMQLTEHFSRIGVPLRLMDAQGSIESEIRHIKTGVALPPGAFDTPKGYQVVSMEDSVKRAKQSLQQQMPAIRQQLQQLQQSGKLSPEAMQKLQGVMKQYQ